MLTAWRIVAAKYKSKAFTGDGARLFGGRWNNKGVAVIYTAGSLALASIELVVHLPSPKLLETFVRIPVRFDPSLVQDLPAADLPREWQSRPISPKTKAIGDAWVRQQRCAVLKVPSIVVPEEHNYLINPAHPDFDKIEVGRPVIYHFDPRLVV
jgi:RES domain-containing protein